MALGSLEVPSAEGKYKLSSAEDAVRLYKTAIVERDRHKEHTLLDDHEWRHVAYWQGIIDVFESMFTSKFSELVDNKTDS